MGVRGGGPIGVRNLDAGVTDRLLVVRLVRRGVLLEVVLAGEANTELMLAKLPRHVADRVVSLS